MPITHAFVSAKSDGADTTLVRPSNWNAAHTGTAPYSTAFEVVLENGGSVLADGVFCDIDVPVACTITSWVLLADQSGYMNVDLWVDDYASFPPTIADTICGGNKMYLYGTASNTVTSLTGWTTSLAAGDVIRVVLDTCATVTRVTMSLRVTVA